MFNEAARQLAVKERYHDIRLLLQCLQKSPLASSELNDDVCIAAIKVLATQSKEVRKKERQTDIIVIIKPVYRAIVRGCIVFIISCSKGPKQ